MTQQNLDHSVQDIYFQILKRTAKVICLTPEEDMEAAKVVLENTFNDMEKLYTLEYNCSPSALDTNSWLLMGALNLAHRVVSLEREANLHTRETISKLLDSIPDDVYSKDSAEDIDRLLPME
ncbi:MAG: hypothetical protein FWG02_02675 [Holophagaceae bacterium]|nr:hypothetical protein [Holophagaceae bacterium]